MGCGCKQKPRQEPQVITSPQEIEIKEEVKDVEEQEEEN